MKYLTSLMALLPGAAMAHGTHAPVPDELHNVTHVLPVVGITILIVTLIAIWRARS